MHIIVGDIVAAKADAIVVPTHSDLKPIPGIRQAVFDAADTRQLTQACRKIGRCPIGRAVLTPSFGLPCRYIIHVAGPGWYSGHRSDRLLFADCCLHALHKACACHCRSVALPLMFSGACHLPRAQALRIVFQVADHFEAVHPDLHIVLVLYKDSIFRLARKIRSGQSAPACEGEKKSCVPGPDMV